MYRIESMIQDDVPEVSRVERRCFTNPWPVSAYRRELQAPQQNYYVVLREMPYAPPSTNGDPNGHGRSGSDGGAPGPPRAMPRRTLLPLGLGRRGEAEGAGRSEAAPAIGFAGMWVLYDEAHITTIGIEPAFRGRRLDIDRGTGLLET